MIAYVTSPASSSTPIDAEALLARLAALEVRGQVREERIGLLEEENRWLKSQLFGRSSEKTSARGAQPRSGVVVQRS